MEGNTKKKERLVLCLFLFSVVVKGSIYYFVILSYLKESAVVDVMMVALFVLSALLDMKLGKEMEENWD